MIFRRILEPILLGSVTNVIVNFIFNPDSFILQWDEWGIACVLSVPITELNRHIDQRLEKKYSWLEFPGKRFSAHFLLISLCLVVSLNFFGIIYMWARQHGFFTLKEYLIIDSVTLCLAMLLTIVNWLVQFYDRWRNAEFRRQEALQQAELLLKKKTSEGQVIELQKGTSKINVESRTIRLASVEHGTVRVYIDKENSGVFPGTLSQFYLLLPGHLFFQVTRDAIVHREIIKTISPSTFGKIDVMVFDGVNPPRTFTISRPKAAAFRKWYNSNSREKR